MKINIGGKSDGYRLCQSHIRWFFHRVCVQTLANVVHATGEEKQRSENSDYETLTPEMRGSKQEHWLRIAGSTWRLKEDQENAINGEQKDNVREEVVCSFWHDGIKRAKSTPKSPPTSEPPTQKDGRSISRRKSLGARSPSGRRVGDAAEDELSYCGGEWSER